MALVTTRDALAAALSTVAGVRGYPRRPTAPRAGDAWPLLDEVTRGPGDSFGGAWRVLVLLGGDERDAVERVDALLPALHGALDAHAYVDGAEPVAVQTEAGDVLALQVRVRSE